MAEFGSRRLTRNFCISGLRAGEAVQAAEVSVGPGKGASGLLDPSDTHPGEFYLGPAYFLSV